MTDAPTSEHAFGRTYEEFQVGDEYRHWPGKTITESDNNLFSLLTMNHHPVHLDAHYAQTQHHGRILVVGTLVLSLVVGLTVRDVSGQAIANLSYDGVRHLAPVFVGDTIYARTTVLTARTSRSAPDRGIVTVRTVASNQHVNDVLELERSLLVPRRTPEDA